MMQTIKTNDFMCSSSSSMYVNRKNGHKIKSAPPKPLRKNKKLYIHV